MGSILRTRGSRLSGITGLTGRSLQDKHLQAPSCSGKGKAPAQPLFIFAPEIFSS